MATPAIHAEQLSKEFRIGQLGGGYHTLRDQLSEFGANLFRRSAPASSSETIWALRDVSLEIAQGEVVGLIGRNGAGKSTLLKVLSRITEPTTGFADIRGRVGSLLEVGTGFHSELTGRENIFLNGAILGMRRHEITRKFDDIVEFAGVEKFIDTPVKRYSSGMYVRLAFAVAAHLETDILLVDEVLAVGDAEFQKRSLGAMRDVTSHGRTVLFVSHNMGSIKALCDRAILLRDGRVAADGDVDRVTAEYLAFAASATEAGEIPADAPRVGSGDARFVGIELLDNTGEPLTAVALGQPVTVRATLEATHAIPDAVFEVGISSFDGIRICTSLSVDGESPPTSLPFGRSAVSLELDVVLLPGLYTIDLGLHHTGYGRSVDFVERVLEFEALNVAEEGADHYPYGAPRGYVRPAGSWRIDAGGERR